MDKTPGQETASSTTRLMVEAKGLAKTFETPQGPTPALLPLDLSIKEGEFISLIGPSGCGKSTLLRLVGDLIAPSAGQLWINGKTPHQARLDRDYGMVFQSAALLEWRSVLKNVELPLELSGTEKEARQATALKMLGLVQLAEFTHHFPGQLSGGMQQRVAIARALSLQPSLLLMDEPFGALDEMTRELMQTELLRIWQETHTTVIFVTHSIPEAVYLSSRVVVLTPRPGQVEEIIPIDIPHPRSEPVRQSEPYFHLITRVRTALRSSETAPELTPGSSAG